MSQYSGPARIANNAPTFYRVESLEAATKVLTADDSGKLLLFNRAGGVDVTLPTIEASTIGMWFRFQVDTPVSGDAYTITAAATQLLSGRVVAWDTDTSYGTTSYAPDESDDLIITLNAGTTGGGVGDDELLLIAESLTRWRVTGQVFHTGNTATMFG